MEILLEKTTAKKVPRQRKPPVPKHNPLVATPLSDAGPAHLGCQSCQLYQRCKTPYLRPYIPPGWTGRLLLVGEAPGEDEDENSQRPFTGRAGRLLQRLWRAAGYKDVDVALVNSIRCRPRKNATPTMSQVRACRGFLLRVIEKARPETVIGLGNTALCALLNQGNVAISDWRGRRLVIPGLSADTEKEPATVYATYHPAAILHGASELEQYIVDDLRRHTLPTLGFPADGPVLGTVVAVDNEWAADGRLLCTAVATPKVARVEAVESEAYDTGIRAPLGNADTLVAHSAADEVLILAANGLPVQETWPQGIDVYDSLLLARMADENQPSYKLDDLLFSSYQVPGDWKTETEAILDKTHDMGAVPAASRDRRCSIDAWASAVLAHFYLPKAGPRPLVQFTHRVAATLSRITLAGAFVSDVVFADLKGELELERVLALDRLTKVALSQGMTDFSPTNDGQIRTLLFEKLRLPVQAYTQKEHLPAVDKANLSQIDHEAVKSLLAYNKADKLYSTNVVGLEDLFLARNLTREDRVFLSYLPFHINPLAAKTARRASNNPNSQNWSKRVRGIITSRYPGGVIGDHDYSKLEPIILAWEAKDDTLMAAFGPGGGGYKYFAKHMWGFDCGDDSPEYRATKSIILGVHYNMQTPKMAWRLWLLGVKFSDDYEVHEQETDRLRRRYLALVPGVVDYMGRQETRLLSSEVAVSASGRVRRLPGGRDPSGRGWGHLLNQAINFPIQSLASDITGSALIDIEAAMLAHYRLSYLDYISLLQEARRKTLTATQEGGIIKGEWWHHLPLLINEVHDDLVYDIPHDQVKQMEELVVETMRAVPSFRKLVPSFDAPLNVGVKVGQRWGV